MSMRKFREKHRMHHRTWKGVGIFLIAFTFLAFAYLVVASSANWGTMNLIVLEALGFIAFFASMYIVWHDDRVRIGWRQIIGVGFIGLLLTFVIPSGLFLAISQVSVGAGAMSMVAVLGTYLSLAFLFTVIETGVGMYVLHFAREYRIL